MKLKQCAGFHLDESSKNCADCLKLAATLKNDELMAMLTQKLDEARLEAQRRTYPTSKDHGSGCHCLTCPHCGAKEVDDCRMPIMEVKWHIRGFKVDNASHCTVCDRWFE